MSQQAIEADVLPPAFSRRRLIFSTAAVLVSGISPLVIDVVNLPHLPVDVLPFVDKKDSYRAYDKFFEGTERIPDNELQEIFGTVQSTPLTDEISLGWENYDKPIDIEVDVDGTQFIYAQIKTEYDNDFSMPVISVGHQNEEFLVAVTQSQLNCDGSIYFRYPIAGKHIFTFSPTEFSYGLFSESTRVQFFELKGEHPFLPGLLQLLPEKIGEVVYNPVHPELLFREDITASLNYLDINQDSGEYRVGLWHKCPKEKGGSEPDELWDKKRELLEGAAHSVVDYDAMSVGVFTKEGFIKKFGWQQDTYRQSHDIIVIPREYLQVLPNGQLDTDVQRSGDHGMFVRGVNRKRGYAPLPEEFLGFDSERLVERNFALGIIGLRQQLARGRMSPNDKRIVTIIEAMQRDVVRNPELRNR